ncbi:hypothetical protein H2248_007401 [Termitomyces sp. 'cryptogamus']|nr:hypothetical protein H2248_007401 [Termitomyces sp. 'cryptogamus']
MLGSIHHLLASNEDIIHVHPNDPAADAFPDWGPWQTIVDDYHSDAPQMPLVAAIRAAQLPRDPIQLAASVPQDGFGMSPKKHHEVTRMSQFVGTLDLPANVRIVDVGAGQGYVTRALHAQLGAPALALDGSSVQTHGSQARGGPGLSGITHVTVHLTRATLVSAIDSWLSATATPTPAPVLLVALHACGTLTPDLFRAVLDLPPTHSWYPAAIVAVGCCYNLMHPPADFPVHVPPLPVPLPASAYQMAAQVPSTWHLSPDRLALTIRKVVWRALLGRLYASSEPDKDTGSTPTMRRLGRLPDSAYASWPTFLKIASQRIGVDLAGPNPPPEPPNPDFQRRLESLHVLRCLFGPVIESYIILDRVEWLKEQVRTSETLKGYSVEAVNLFDQATGSGRNVALVLRPAGK